MSFAMAVVGGLAVAASVLLNHHWELVTHVIRPPQLNPAPIGACGGWQDKYLRRHISENCPNNTRLMMDYDHSLKHDSAHDDSADESLSGASESSTQLSLQESFGFFEEPDSHWLLRKQIHRAQLLQQRMAAAAYDQCQHAAGWWAGNFHPSFHCSLKSFVGENPALGQFWVCDLPKIVKQAKKGKGCLVYSIGSDGEFSFEDAVHGEISSECEVHTFDPNPVSYYNGEGAEAPKYVNYHAYPVGADTGQASKHPKTLNYTASKATPKSMPTIIKELGHEGRTIDLFKINCEGCEFDTFKSWFSSGVKIRQILAELHWNHCDPNMGSKVRAFFSFLHEQGYVAFHREPGIAWDPEAPGSNVDFSFVLLSQNFTGRL